MTNHESSSTYTFDIFGSLDGFGAHTGDWGGYWGKQGPEFLAHRLAQLTETQRMLFGATPSGTSRQCSPRASIPRCSIRGDPDVGAADNGDSVHAAGTSRWPDATVAAGNAVETVRRLKASDFDLELVSGRTFDGNTQS